MTDKQRRVKASGLDPGAEKTISAIEGIVRILGPLGTDDRQRALQGALVVLGEKLGGSNVSDPSNPNTLQDDESHVTMAPRARIWMRQNNLNSDQIAEIFDISDGIAAVIAAEVVGKTNSEKTIKAYVLAGLANFLSSGEPNFDDKSARALCESFGCYDNTNHTKHMKEKGNYFVGDKAKGWKLTAPGLKYGANIVLELSELEGA